MNDMLMQRLANHGPMLMMGTTVLMGLGCIAIRLSTLPIHRQRLGELTLGATLLWMILALMPLPRLLPRSVAWFESKSPANAILKPQSGERFASHESEFDLAETQSIERNQRQNRLSRSEEETLTPTLSALSPQNGGVGTREYSELISDDLLLASVEMTHDISSGDTAPAFDVLGRSSILMASVVFAIGALACIVWLAFGQTLLVLIRIQSQRPEPWLLNLFQNLAKNEKLACTRLLMSPTCRRAISWGAIWPVIVLPAALCQRKNEAQLRMILLHELGHTAQGDAWGNLLLTLAFPLLYAQPLYWWLRSQVRLAAELMADDYAARQSDKETYALELIALAKTANGVGVLWGVTGVVSSPSQFYRRMQMLIVRETPLALKPSASWRMGSFALAGIAIALAAAMLGSPPAEGQQDTPEAPPVKKLDAALDHAQADSEKKSVKSVPFLGELPIIGQLFVSENPSDLLPASVPVVIEVRPTQPDGVKPPVVQNVAPVKELPVTLPIVENKVSFTQLAETSKTESDATDEETYYLQSPDGKDIEILVERGGKMTSRITGKRIVLKGNRIIQAQDYAVELSRKDPKSGQKLGRTLGVLVEAAPKSFAREPVVDSDGNVHLLTADDGGKLWIEKRHQKDGQLIERFQLPSQVVARIGDDVKAHGPFPLQPDVLDRAKRQHLVDLVVPVAETPAKATAENRRTDESAVPATAAGSAKQIDLISLATSYADAISSVEAATDAESKQRASRKANLLLRIAQVEYEAVSSDFNRMESLMASGVISERAVTEIKSRRNILREILNTDSNANESKPGKPDGLKR